MASQTPRPQSASELYRQSGRHQSAKAVVLTLAGQSVIFQMSYLEQQNDKMQIKLHYNDIKLQSPQIQCTTITEISNLQDSIFGVSQ
jgi:hypothetical protein